MKIRTLLGSAVLGLVVASGLVGVGAAQADLNPRPCCLSLAPTLTVTGGLGAIAITGANWPASKLVGITVFNPGNSSPADAYYEVPPTANGSFSVTYTAPNRCSGNQMKIIADDGTAITKYAVPGCLWLPLPFASAAHSALGAPQADSFNFTLRS